jgi:hypothetical protein
LNEVETKDLCTVRYSSTANKVTKVFYFVALKFAGLPDYHILIDSLSGQIDTLPAAIKVKNY